MDIARKAFMILPTLDSKDLRVLNAIERGMARHEMVPIERIATLSGLNLSEVYIRIRRLHKLGLVQRTLQPYVGYALTRVGYDCLALNALTKSGVLKELGRKLGVGKEADVYEAVSSAGSKIAVKFHRLGRISFRRTRRLRSFIGDRRHISWLYQSRLAAQQEFKALQLVYENKVHVPQPIKQNRHVVVTSFFEGVELVEVDYLPDPEELLENIIEDIKRAYEVGVVHCDLSEYNIIVNIKGDSTEYVIIDWPQWVSNIHPNAMQYLRRDIEHIINYFKRNFKVYMDVEEVLKYVTSKS